MQSVAGRASNKNTPAGRYQMLVQFLRENIADLEAVAGCDNPTPD